MTNVSFAPNESFRDSTNKLIYGLIIRNSLLMSAVTVGVTAVALPTSALSRRLFLVVFNNSSAIIYIGGSNVTTSDGYPILPRGQFMFTVDDNVSIYAIAGTAGNDVRILEAG